MADIRVSDELVIPEAELSESFARSGGPGGQHVNTAATKVELRFDVDASPTLSRSQRERIHERLDSRLTADGELILTASEHRSQARNREAARARLAALLGQALTPRARRRPTRRPRHADRRRIDQKKRRGERKRLRQRPPPP